MKTATSLTSRANTHEYNPEYLQMAKLKALPEEIDDLSRNILQEKYSIIIPDSDHDN